MVRIKKFKFMFFVVVMTMVVFSGLATASTTYSIVTDPTTITTYQPNYYSNAGYIDLVAEFNVPAGSIVKSVQLIDYSMFSSCGSYGSIYIRMFNESGQASPLKVGALNYDFQGQSATQKFYIKFYTTSMQFSGNALTMNRPLIAIDVE